MENNLNLESIVTPSVVSNTPDPKTAGEERRLEVDKRQYDLELQKSQHALESDKQDMRERAKYADRIFILIVAWLFGVFLILILQGLFAPNLEKLGGFHLSDNVLIALITGTTINVLGIFAIVANYLFNSSHKKSTR